MAKIDKLKQITGNNKIDDLEDDILDGDFDAAKYDKIMQQVIFSQVSSLVQKYFLSHI